VTKLRMSKLTTLLFLRRFALFLTQSSLRSEFRKNIIQIIKTSVQIFAPSNTLSKFKEARNGPAGKHLATRVGQHNNTNSATERIDSTGSADRRGAV